MKKWITAVRLLLLMIAIGTMGIGLLPADTTAEVMDGPCLDDGCPGGDSFCDYVLLGGEWKPCNMGIAAQEVE